MITMKRKNRVWQAAVLMSAALCMWGCGDAKQAEEVKEEAAQAETANTESDVVEKEKSSEKSSEESAEESVSEAAQGYCFMAGNVKIQADMDMDELKAELEESQSVFETPSCAGDGTAYIYNYVSYEIETYPAGDGKNRIAYITLKDDTVSTPEGADLSMTREDVIRIYGEEFEEIGDKISYEKEETKLNFIFDGDNIISIEYASVVIG